MANNMFSIILPYYNNAAHISKCLESLSNQEFRSFEVIIVSNGSTADEIKKLREMIEEPNYKIIVRTKKGGPGYARNIGLNHSNGKYIIYIDCDDYISNDLLITLNNTISDNYGIEVIKYNALRVNEALEPIQEIKHPGFGPISGQEALKILIESQERIFSPAWMYCSASDFIKNNQIYFTHRKHEDYGNTSIMLMSAHSVMSLNYTGYYYLQRADGIIRDSSYENSKIKAMDFIYLSKMLLMKAKEMINDEKIKESFIKYIIDQSERKAKYLKGEDLDIFQKNNNVLRKEYLHE